MSIDFIYGPNGATILTEKDKKYEEALEKAEKLEKALKQLLAELGSAAQSGNCSSLLGGVIDALSECEDDAKKMIAKLEDLENQLLPHIQNAQERDLAKKEIEQLIDEAKQLEKTCAALLATAKSAKGNAQGIEELATGLESVLEQKKKIEEAIDKLEQNLQKLILQNSTAPSGQHNPFTRDVKLMLSENIDRDAKAQKKQIDTTAAHLQLLEEAYAKLHVLLAKESSQVLNDEGLGKTGSGHGSQHFGGSLAG